MIDIKFDTSSLQKNLEQFAKDIQEQAIRPAAYAASKVLYEEMQIRVPVGETGNLKNSIYQYHNEKLSQDGKQVYSVGVNKRKAPHWHLLEYGTIRAPAYPFIVPTYDAKIVQAMAAARARLAEKIEEIKND
jgi:HK97 gp10 family phage protein